MALVQGELRRIARQQMAGERRDHLLQPTALVNEAFMRMVGVKQVQWHDRTHFFAMSARLMRRVLIDMARSRDDQKHGGGFRTVTFDERRTRLHRGHDLIALDEALEALAVLNARKSRVVELKFFGGLSVEEIAGVLNVSAATVLRDWKIAKAWLLRELADDERRAE